MAPYRRIPSSRITTLLRHVADVRGPSVRGLCMRGQSNQAAAAASADSKPWRLSASVVILAPYHTVPDCSLTDVQARDTHFDYRVCCVKRAAKSSFMPDTMVFPGGAVDAQDVTSAEALLGTRDLEATLRCAAIREAFEESGVSLFEPAAALEAALMRPQERAKWRARLRDDASLLPALCAEMGLAPAAGTLHFWCTFITPDAQHAALKKGGFDTRFYVCCASGEAVFGATADEQETTQLLWLTPAEALDAVQKGSISMVPPQWYILKELSDSCPTLASVPGHAASESRKLQREYPIKPYPAKLTDAEKEGMLARHGKDSSSKEPVFSMCYPGDEAHPVFPGPEGMRHRLLMIGKFGGRLLFELQRGAPPLPIKQAMREWYTLAKL